jgi:hypothetical protein
MIIVVFSQSRTTLNHRSLPASGGAAKNDLYDFVRIAASGHFAKYYAKRDLRRI